MSMTKRAADWAELEAITQVSNLGGGIGVFKQKDGDDAQLKSLNTSGAPSLYDDTGKDEIEVSLDLTALSEKTTPVDADLVLIQDSAAGYADKKVQVQNLPGTGGGGDYSIDGGAADSVYTPEQSIDGGDANG